MNKPLKKISVQPLSEKNWKDFELLFGERGASGGCWCMVWRLKAAQFKMNKAADNKRAMHRLVKKGRQIGLIAYVNNVPAGWCSVASREDFVRLEKSRVLAPIDDQPVWSISCFFIDKEFRRQGLSTEILKKVIEFCKKKKVKILEGYPIYPYDSKMPSAFAWNGFVSAFEKAGFVEAAKRSSARPIMRYQIK